MDSFGFISSLTSASHIASVFTSSKVWKFGEKGSGVRFHGKVQDFQKLRDQCLAEGRLFEDTEFPAQDSTIFSGPKPREWPFVWKRPHEVTSDPHLFVGGASRFDVIQGTLGDCWILAALANLTMNPQLFSRVVPDDQGFSPEKKYAGIFHFRFWRHGKWVEVVVDDLLPQSNGQFVFMKSKSKNEFWSALLEKAYAKLFGSYEHLREGKFNEAMEDLTGGLTEVIDLKNPPKDLYSVMSKAYERLSFMGCSIPAHKTIREAVLPTGLVQGHAYSITGIKTVHLKSEKVKLLRLRNPWGKVEWNGAWSGSSNEWQSVPKEEREQIGLLVPHDGEFWMSFDDFLKNFNGLDMCHLDPGYIEKGGDGKRWELKVFEGSWTKNVTAGGLNQQGGMQHINPQYGITLAEHDEDDDEEVCTLILALMQKNSRAQKKMGIKKHNIGFLIYKKESPSAPKPLPKQFFDANPPAFSSETFENLREVTQRFRVPRGSYCILPSTWNPGEEGEFLLRVFTEKCHHLSENEGEIQIVEADQNALRKAAESQKRDPFSELFLKIAGDDLEVDAYELKEVLDHALQKEFNFPGFGINLCRGLVAMMDHDRTGKLGMEEFKRLWFDVTTWKTVFKMYDPNNTGTMKTEDLRTALLSSGYNLHWRVLKVLALRFANRNGTIGIEDFIMCAVKLKTMIEAFKERDPAGRREATLSLDEFVELTMYA